MPLSNIVYAQRFRHKRQEYLSPAEFNYEVRYARVDDVSANSLDLKKFFESLTANSINEYNSRAMLATCMHPLADKDAIMLRQDAIYELVNNSVLHQEIIASLIAIKTYDTRHHDRDFEQEFRRQTNILRAVEILSVIKPESAQLMKVRDFAQDVRRDKDYRKMRPFYTRFMKGYDIERLVEVFKRRFTGEDSFSSRGDPFQDPSYRLRFLEDLGLFVEAAKSTIEERSINGMVHRDAKKDGVYREISSAAAEAITTLRHYSRTHHASGMRWFGQLKNLTQQVVAEWTRGLEAGLPSINFHNVQDWLDFYVTAASATHKMKTKAAEKGLGSYCRPTFKGSRRISIQNAANINLIYSDKVKKLVANDVVSQPDCFVHLVSGMNSGGKSCYIQLPGQIAWLSQLGMLPPAEKVSMSVYDAIFSCFPEHGAAGAGYFETQGKRAKNLLLPDTGVCLTPNSLLIYDDMGTGTEPDDAIAFVKTIVIDGLLKRGVTTYGSFHVIPIAEEIKAGGVNWHGAENMAVELLERGEELIPTYRVRRGKIGSSSGSIVMKKLGLTPKDLAQRIVDDQSNGLYTVQIL